MKNIGSIIRHERQALGLSQTALSFRSTISFPSIQLIESERGNPSLKTIQLLFDALGIEFNIQSKKANWSYLVQWGLPLLELENESKDAFNLDYFIDQIKLACRDVLLNFNSSHEERKIVSLESLLLVIKKHYPSFFKKYLSKSSHVENCIPKDTDGRHIKLMRIALARIQEVL